MVVLTGPVELLTTLFLKKLSSAEPDPNGKNIPPTRILYLIGSKVYGHDGNFHSYVVGHRSEMVFRSACTHLP